MIHSTAILDYQPEQSAALGRKTHRSWLPVALGENVSVGPFAVVFAGVTIGDDTLVGISLHDGSR